MSYDLAVWEGERPESDVAATGIYTQLMDGMEVEDDGQDPPPLSETDSR